MVLIEQPLAEQETDSLPVAKAQGHSNRTGTASVSKGHGPRGRAVSWVTRYHDGKSGYLSQSSLPLWFALGEATTIERIEVLWPSGVSQTLDQRPSIGQTLEIVEPS